MLGTIPTPYRTDPFAEVRRLQASLDGLLDTASPFTRPAAWPPVDLWMGDGSLVALFELPGVAADDLELSVEQDTLRIKGRRPRPEGGDVRWLRQERTAGNFSRTIALPFRVDPEKVKARFENGILAVEVERPQEDLPRRIAIAAN